MNGIKGLLAALTLCLLAACNQNTKVDDNLYRIMVGEKYGFIDASGKIVIEPQFDDAHKRFSEGVCYVEVGERKGLIDRTGVIVLELADSINFISYFNNGLSSISADREIAELIYFVNDGVINKKGELVIPAMYRGTEVQKDGDDVYVVVDRFKDLIITDENGTAIGMPCDSILSGFVNGLCAVKINEKWGYMNTSGELVIDTVYDYVRVFTDDGVARVRKGSEHFFIDKMGNRLFSVDETLTGMVCNRAAVVLNGETCLVDKSGKRICTIDADIVYSFNKEDKMATIVKNGKVSKIDTLGNVVLRTNYRWIGEFVDGVAEVFKDGKWGYIDTEGNEIVSVVNSRTGDVRSKGSQLIDAWNKNTDGTWVASYYDLQGNLIWRDAPTLNNSVEVPWRGSKDDFKKYFEKNISELDPIEGIYYVTQKGYAQDRENPHSISTQFTQSFFYAIVYSEDFEGYGWYGWHGDTEVDDDGPNVLWRQKFVKIGNTNTYAVMNIGSEETGYTESQIEIKDFSKFEFKIDYETDSKWYDYFITYQFVRDCPDVINHDEFQRTEWTGSGFAIADGYIVTNYHVTNGAKTIRIKGVNGDMEEAYKGFVVASDKEHDLSIVKIVDKDFEGFDAIPYKIGKTTVDVGDDIFVLGYPMTQTMGEEVKLTNGVISAASGYKGDASMYQISAAVQSGNSGGPLFNEDGAVIGVVCAKHAGAENANYAVKVSYLYSLITSSNLGIDISGNDKVKGKSLSKQVKKIRDFVYLIECSSK